MYTRISSFPCFCVGGLLGRTRPREDTTDPFRPTPLWYAPNCDLQPDSNGEIPLNLKAEIEPIPCRANDLVLEAVTDEQKAVVQWSYTAYDPSLSEAVVGFLRSKIHGQSRSESAYHSRNDCFLDIIRIIGATKSRYSILDMTRDQYERGKTEAETGPDATIYEERYPELVVVEEQAMYDLVNAERELCAKFAFLPHYLRLTRIVGIVIAGNQFKIGFIHRDPMRFQVLMNLTTGQAGNGYTLVRAAVNIGIWFRATMNRGLLERISFSFGVGSGSSHSHLTIFRHQFRKVLYEHADVDLKALSKFYKSIRSHRIPYFEYPLNERNMDSVALVFDTLELVMKPVGLARQPRTSDELKDCLLCILTALQDLHGRGYVHLDLRWPNVIIVAQREWYIIDGEYVRKSGDPYPQNLLIRAGDVAHYSADLTMLGMMLGALDDRDLLTSNVQELIDYLTKGRTRRSAGGALRLVRRW